MVNPFVQTGLTGLNQCQSLLTLCWTASEYLLSVRFNDVFDNNVDYQEEYGDSDFDESDIDVKELHNQTWGAVSVLYDGLSGRICYDGWDDQDAGVACREMGFLHGQAYSHYSDWLTEYKTNIVWSANFNCT